MSARESRRASLRTALHEAGHATIAIIEGCRFDDVVIAKRGTTTGFVRNLRYRRHDDEIVRVVLAGIMSVRLQRRRWDRFLYETAHNDLGTAADFYREREGNLLEWNVDYAAARILEHWGAIRKIVHRLHCEQQVTFSDAFSIVNAAKPGSAGPCGSLGKKGWTPLIDQIRWRIKYPRGIDDMVAEARMQISKQNRSL